MSAPVRVCPTCGEQDDMPQFWTPKCERDWLAIQEMRRFNVVGHEGPHGIKL